MKNFKTKRERLEKEIEKEYGLTCPNCKNIIYPNSVPTPNKDKVLFQYACQKCKSFNDFININREKFLKFQLKQAKLTQLNECEEMTRKEIDELKADDLAYGYKDYEKQGESMSTMEICDREGCNSFVIKRIKQELKQNLFGEEKC